MESRNDHFDVVVVGAGFGGLATTLALAEAGAKVALCEVLDYPGGCAATFQRKGYLFEAGATLFSGLGEGQLFHQWIERYQLPITVDWLDPAVELRTPDMMLRVGQDPDVLLSQLCALPGAPQAELRAFFHRQRQVADVLWAIFNRPELLPPLSAKTFLHHVGKIPSYLGLVDLVGTSLYSVVKRYGLGGFKPLKVYLDALCQITLQCSSDEAEAPFALAVMDYYYRGTGHVRGGIGTLAWGLVKVIRDLGGRVFFSRRVRNVSREQDGWKVQTRAGDLHSRVVVGNVLPQNMRTLLGIQAGDHTGLDKLAQQVEQGWGAAMLYLVSRTPEANTPHPQHLELVQDPSRPMVEGNHLFVSISGEHDTQRAPEGHRTLTVSTHVPLSTLRRLPEEERAEKVAQIQKTMELGLTRLAPEWVDARIHTMTASPRTFERFTLRDGGWVGGIPRRQGLHNYLGLTPFRVKKGLYLVGDSTYLGQSTFATALSGIRLAEEVQHELDLPPGQR